MSRYDPSDEYLLFGDEDTTVYPVGVVPQYLLDLEDAQPAPAPPSQSQEDTPLGADLQVEVDDGEPIEALAGHLKVTNLSGANPVTADLQIALINRARDELLRCDLTEAANTLERADSLGPNDAVVMAHNAWLRLLTGERFSATWLADQALAAAPDNPAVVVMVMALRDELAD
ncbi:MAG: hypothetical protein GXP62_10995 [Oligoflexia bacterium]|nr:hypothetical protein [Oligoflexia bacterium]